MGRIYDNLGWGKNVTPRSQLIHFWALSLFDCIIEHHNLRRNTYILSSAVVCFSDTYREEPQFCFILCKYIVLVYCMLSILSQSIAKFSIKN